MSYNVRLRRNKPRSDDDMYREFRSKDNLEEHERNFLLWYESGGSFDHSKRRWARELRQLICSMRRSGHTIEVLYEPVQELCSMASLKNSGRFLVLREETCREIVRRLNYKFNYVQKELFNH